MPRLAMLQERHPSVDLQLAAIKRPCDLAREQIDLAIRYGAGWWRGLEAHRLMPELYLPVASAEFLRRTPGKDPAELLRTSRTISNALHPDEWTEWCGAHGLQPPRTSNMIELNSAELVCPPCSTGLESAWAGGRSSIRCWKTEDWCRRSVIGPSARRSVIWCSRRPAGTRRCGRSRQEDEEGERAEGMIPGVRQHDRHQGRVR